MKKTKKIFMGILSVFLVVAMTIGGTLAFLTDSEKATNTFTVGDLDITLTEPNWNDEIDGKNMIAGETVVKDPTVVAIDNDSYMRVIVTIKDSTTGQIITDQERLDLITQTIRYDDTYDNTVPTVGTGLVEGTGYTLADITTYPNYNSDFTLNAGKSGNGVYYYNYNTVFTEGEKATLFTNVAVPSDWNQEQLTLLGNYSIEVFAQAIQADNFATAADAFAALDAEISGNTMKEDYKTVTNQNGGSGTPDEDNGPSIPVGPLPDGAVVVVGDQARIESGDIQDGDEIEYGDYIYKYNYVYDGNMRPPWALDTSINGWGVRVKDDTKTSYGEIYTSICGKPVTSLSDTFYGCDSLTEAPVIPNGIIGMQGTFATCATLTTPPEIPNSVTDMTKAFTSCPALETAPVIPNSVTTLSGTFQYCSALTTVPALPNSIRNMEYAFASCKSLTTAPAIPDGVEILKVAFNSCTSLTTPPVIPDSVTDMYSTFMNCSNLTSAPAIPNKVTRIKDAFSECNRLVTPPDLSNATSLQDMEAAFFNCSSLISAPVIPGSVINMTQTFEGCRALTTAPPVIPGGVTEMTRTFRGCSKLQTAPVLSEGIVNLLLTFSNCSALTTAPSIPESVDSMSSTFYNCTKLKSAPVIPNGVSNMNSTFYNCTTLSTAPTIPDTVTSMGQTFYGCGSLTGNVTVNANPTTYDACFTDTINHITLTGSSTLLNELAATSTIGNVTVG